MTEITTASLTTKEKDGTGVFDELMQSVQVRLEDEYSRNRVQGTDYAKLYLAAMDSVLQQSIAFILGRQNADKQAELLAAQAASEALNAPLIQAQIDKIAAEILLTNQQILTAQAQTANTVKEGALLDAKTALALAEKDKLIGVDTDLATAQKNKTDAEKLLLDKEALKTVEETLLVTQNTANVALQSALYPKQGLKLDSEINLLVQKTDTEKAQILDTVNAVTVVGVVGKQKELFTAQKEGFARDAEQKAAKLVVDAWSVKTSLDPGGASDPVGIKDADVTAIMTKVKQGIGAV